MKTKILAINYANIKFKNAQHLNTHTALLHGADKVIEYSEGCLDDAFYQNNREILKQKRGNGYWLWKPYIIQKSLAQMDEGEYLIYSDSGSFYMDDIELLIHSMQDEKMEIMVFTLPESYLEKIWSKRDAFILMDCDSDKYCNSPQRLAGFLLIKKTVYTYNFVSEWMLYAQDPRILTDQENCMGKDNYVGFRENRHDQTVLSLLSKKHGLKAFRNPACVMADNSYDILKRSKYPQIFDLHRMPDVLTVEDVRKKRLKIVEHLVDYWDGNKEIVLYGAGKNAKKVLAYVKCKGLKVLACVVSDNQIICEPLISDIKVYHFSELKKEKKDVKILSTVNIPEIYEVLKRSGYDYEIIDGLILNALTSIM